MRPLTTEETVVLKERIGDRKIIASVSGGKDSAAMCLHLQELGLPYEAVAMDTGWEWRGWREYVEGPLTAAIGPIKILSSVGLAATARKKGIFPSRLRRWCTEELKVKPFSEYVAARQDAGDDPLVAVGVRAAESAARAKFTEWEWQAAYDAEVWRPLLHWTAEDVIAIHARHGLHPNPLYLKGAHRVGCWPCIYASKDEIRLVSEIDTARIDEIRQLEEDVTTRATEIVQARGETLQRGRTFFAAPNGTGEEWRIDKVVAWSRTSRGGVQLAVFQHPADEGCMRWGLCETMSDDEAA